MAYTLLTPVSVDLNGDIDPTYAAATLTDGDQYKNTGREIIHIKNDGGGTVVVTVPTPATASGGLTIEDKTYTLLTTEEIFIGQLDTAIFNQPASSADAGNVYIEYDDVTSVTLAIFKN